MVGGKFRAFIDLSRVHGAPIIIGFCLLGMLSGAGSPSWADFLGVIVIGFVFKCAGSVHNELVDLEADSRDPVLQKKPIQSGMIARGEAQTYMAGCLVGGISLSVILLPPGVAALVFLAVGTIFFYNARGKYIPVLYETLFAAAMVMLLLAGAMLAGGPTRITAVLVLTVFTSNLFAQWLNGCRDVGCDRAAGVGSIPSLHARATGDESMHVLSGLAIWVLYTFSLLLPFILCVVRIVYLPLTMGIHAGMSAWLFRQLPKAVTRSAFNRLLVFQVVAYWFVIPVFLVDRAGWTAWLGLLAFTILGTGLAIAAERASQYRLAFDAGGAVATGRPAAGGAHG